MSPSAVEPASVTVRGTGAAQAVPDVAVVDLSAEVSSGSPEQALDEAATANRTMIDTALAAGVDRPDVTTTGVQLWTDYRDAQVAGFRATLSTSLRVRDLASLGALLSALVSAGGAAARLQGTRFEHSDPSGLAQLAREAAFADAKARAGQYATLAGRSLGAVLSVDETSPARGDGPVPVARAMAASALAVPVEAGTQAVTASVLVRWELG
jgi:uncharacterized protein YggE